MKSIKTYLLLLFLLALFGVQAFSQTSSEKEMYNKEYKFSKTDSVLAETYLTERDYIDKHGLEVVSVCEDVRSKDVSSDEIYNETPSHRNNSRYRSLDAGTVSFIVDVAIHTIFLITLFWQ